MLERSGSINASDLAYCRALRVRAHPMLTSMFLAEDLSATEQQELNRFIDHPETLALLNPRSDETQVRVGDQDTLVFKVFNIRRFKQRWRARWKHECPVHGQRHGWAERSNAERFQALGLPGLPTRAYLENRTLLGCKQQVVAYPYLSGHQTLHERLQHDPLQALDAVEPVLLRLAQAGVFHLDLNTRNLMLDTDDQVRVIDFEYMAWDQSRKGEIYSYSLGYLFQKWARHSIESDAFDQWAHHLMERNAESFGSTAHKLLAAYTLGKKVELSRAKRYRIFK